VKVRLRYAKLGKVRFTSHRDTARVWERALRKADLPVAMSAGFTPRPRVSFGLALPTGTESVAEYLDVDRAEAIDDRAVGELPARLTAALPGGFTALLAAPLATGSASLQESVTSVTWELALPAVVDVPALAARLLAAGELPIERERKGQRRRDDVRPQIVALAAAGAHTLVAELATTGRGIRPAELVALALPDVEPFGVRALRTHQWIDHDGHRRDVLALDDDVRAALGTDQVVVPALEVGA
jgi:radical SAM-linked protein